MNTKLVSLLTAFGLCINAAFAGNSARIGYASDYFYRGVQKAEESIQASLRLEHSLGLVDGSLHVCSNQAVDSGNDSYHMGIGAGKSFADGLVSAYAGLNHFEDVPGNALSEVEVRIALSTVLAPSISVYRDLDDSLYTVEVGVAHTIETEVANLTASASAGNTETSSSVDSDYYSLGVAASRSISENADLGLGLSYLDADNIDDEVVLGASLTFNF